MGNATCSSRARTSRSTACGRSRIPAWTRQKILFPSSSPRAVSARRCITSRRLTWISACACCRRRRSIRSFSRRVWRSRSSSACPRTSTRTSSIPRPRRVRASGTTSGVTWTSMVTGHSTLSSASRTGAITAGTTPTTRAANGPTARCTVSFTGSRISARRRSRATTRRAKLRRAADRSTPSAARRRTSWTSMATVISI